MQMPFLYLICINAVGFGFIFLSSHPPPPMLQNIKIHVNLVNDNMTTGQLFPGLQNALLIFGP